jgi:ABC-type transport system involved in multi-copper enzyme maturation permease subunit
MTMLFATALSSLSTLLGLTGSQDTTSVAMLTATIFFFSIFIGFIFFSLTGMMNNNKDSNGKQVIRPPVAPFGMFTCIKYMTTEDSPWFPLRAQITLKGADTFVLPLPRRPVLTGDAYLAREILMDPLSIKPKTYQEFEPFGIGSIFTRNGSYWVSVFE